MKTKTMAVMAAAAFLMGAISTGAVNAAVSCSVCGPKYTACIKAGTSPALCEKNYDKCITTCNNT